MKSVTLNSIDYYLFEERPKWQDGLTGKFHIPVERERSPTGRETLQPMGHELRCTLQYTAVIYELEASSYRVGVQDLTNQPILCPFWPALDVYGTQNAQYVDENGDPYVDENGDPYVTEGSPPISTGLWLTYERDWSDWEVHTGVEPSGFTPSGLALTVPVLVGYFTEVPQALVKTPEFLELAVDFMDKGPVTYALQLDTAEFTNGPQVAGRTPKVFPLHHFWGTPEGGRAGVEIERQDAGYNREPVETYYPQNTERQFGFDTYLEDWDDCVKLLRFFRDHQGMARDFWVPQPLGDCQVVSIAGNVLTVNNAAGLGINRYIALYGPQRQVEYHHVASVDTGANTITLDTATAFTRVSLLCSLVLCRFSKSEITVNWITNGQAKARLNFQELAPQYYAPSGEQYGVDFGPLPTRCFLYIFSGPWAAPKYYAQHERDVTLNGQVYVANKGFTHDGHTERMASDAATISLKGRVFSGGPFELFFPFRLESAIWCQVLRCEVDGLGNASNASTVYYGKLGKPKFDGPKVTVPVRNLGHLFDQNVPNVLRQPSCNVELFHPRCSLLATNWEFTGQVVSISGKTLLLDTLARTVGSLPTLSAHYFSLGWLEHGSGEDLQRKAIADSLAAAGGQLQLTLLYPFVTDPAVDDVITFYPGCDQNISTCKAKFNNLANFRGFYYVPTGNPLTNPIQETNVSGGKK